MSNWRTQLSKGVSPCGWEAITFAHRRRKIDRSVVVPKEPIAFPGGSSNTPSSTSGYSESMRNPELPACTAEAAWKPRGGNSRDAGVAIGSDVTTDWIVAT